MSSLLLETLSQNFRKARLVNQTSASYVSKVPTFTEPSGDAGTATGASVFDLNKGGQSAQNAIIVCPYAVGSNNNTFSVRIVGWRLCPKDTIGPEMWIPVNLIELACTISSSCPGVTGGTLLATEFFADTITVTVGSTLAGESASENVVSPANDTIAHALVDLKGFQKVELSFTTGSSATSCNALLALL